jgi:hypothetical protein
MNHPSELVEGTPGIVREGNTLHATAAGRQSCLVKGCFATFVSGGAAVDATAPVPMEATCTAGTASAGRRARPGRCSTTALDPSHLTRLT